MAKPKSVYACAECGATALQWFGTCPSCGAAGTLSESTAERGAKRIATPSVALADIEARELARIPTGVGELDRALGAGLVAGQVVLLGGDPGIGKSTLLLQTLATLKEVLYVTGEESAEQIAMRARRLSLDAGGFRLVRAVKNRFGAVNELGVFAMTDKGLRGVTNPSALFLSQHPHAVPGSCVVATLEGTRPLLVEIQALVDAAHAPNPRRLSVGLEQNRLAMLLAVLHRHAGIATWEQDVFVNAVGGVRI